MVLRRPVIERDNFSIKRGVLEHVGQTLGYRCELAVEGFTAS